MSSRRFAGGDGGHGYEGVVVEGVEGLDGGAGLAAGHVEAASDGVEHLPEAGAVFGVTIQVGVEGAVAITPAAQGSFGVPVGSALLGVAGGRFDLGHLLVEFGQRTVLGFVDQCGGFGGVGGDTVSDGGGLFQRHPPGQRGGGHLRLVHQPTTGLQGPLGRGGAHPRPGGELFRR